MLDHYERELAQIGGETTAVWQGSIALVVSDEQVYAATFTYRTVLTSTRRGRPTPGAPLDALTVDPATGRCFSELAWQDRPDHGWVFRFVRQHLDKLDTEIVKRRTTRSRPS